MDVGAYFIICPVCKHRIEVKDFENGFTAECKNCGTTISCDVSNEPLTLPDDLIKAGEQLQESFRVEPEETGCS